MLRNPTPKTPFAASGSATASAGGPSSGLICPRALVRKKFSRRRLPAGVVFEGLGHPLGLTAGFVFALAMLLGAPRISAYSGSEEPFVGRLEEEVMSALTRYRVPGVAVALLQEGRVAWERGFGVADRGSGELIDVDSVFQVASLSKPVTALGVLLLVEDGKLDLDRPVGDYLRRWKVPSSDFDVDGVTARRLLSHRGGTNLHGYPGFEPDSPLPDLEASLSGATGGAGRVVLDFEPGSRVSYSSGGYSVLQLLIEEISGEDFAVFMRRRVLEPLGMRRSSFDGDPQSQTASGHGWWGNTLPAYRFRARAASGLYSTAGDLARFLGVLSDPVAQAKVGISPDLVELMLSPPAEGRGGYSLGFALEAVPGTRIVSHAGANRGWRSVLGAAAERGDAIVVLTNSDRGLPLTIDALCAWGRNSTGLELASCWAERKSRGTLLAVAALLCLGLLMDSWSFVRYRFRRSSRIDPDRYRWVARVRMALSLLVLILWWLFWYTDEIVVRREGVENFLPVSSVPPTFFWLTLVLSVWCLLGVVRWLAGLRDERAPAVG